MNQIHELGAVNAKMSGDEKEVRAKVFFTEEQITPEMAEAGITTETELKTREEMVAELGEDAVALIEANAIAFPEPTPAPKVAKRGKK